ncbi:M28 family peptidase [Streptomyces sp. NPDC059629]|uniref:M28 family peptidase n=1 Tax=Streptomyces sp. NPDC059629 TaxID=3346889 RepID=UPI00368D4C8D
MKRVQRSAGGGLLARRPEESASAGRKGSRRTTRAMAALAVAAGLCLVSQGAAGVTVAEAAEGRAPAPPTISQTDVMTHLQVLQRIADRNGGNRALGTKGDDESFAHVKRVLDASGFVTHIEPFTYQGKRGHNLIADWPGGDRRHVIMAGAHLDSVPEGPGINDNGSGSAALLAVAQAVGKSHLSPQRHLRFAWWDGEEPGLIGSADYVAALSPQARSAIDSYSNFDQTGSKHVDYRIVTKGDPETYAAYEKDFAERSQPTFEVDGAGGSDDASFESAGIPLGGFTTGISDCIHEPCDDLSNVDPATETSSANTILDVTWSLVTSSHPTATPEHHQHGDRS